MKQVRPTEDQQKFIKYLISRGVIKIGGPFTLKNKRVSPYFCNIGVMSNGDDLNVLGEAIASTITSNGLDETFDTIYGIPEKGNHMAVMAVSKLAEVGFLKTFFATRKESKTHGEMSSVQEDWKKKIVGDVPKQSYRIMLLDDVFTDGASKYETVKKLQTEFSDLDITIAGLIIVLDRQEVTIDGKNAVEEFTKTTGIPVYPVINSEDVLYCIKNKVIEIDSADARKFENYLMVYGTKEIKKSFGYPEHKKYPHRGIVPALDFTDLKKLEEIATACKDNPKVTGFKIGALLIGAHGMKTVVELLRSINPDKIIIYDQQKAGTDIPETGEGFMRQCCEAGVDAVILFPLSGPEVLRAWTYYAYNYGLQVIVGGVMTHAAFLKSEGGWIDDNGAYKIYEIAAGCGVDCFIVPGTKIDAIKKIKTIIDDNKWVVDHEIQVLSPGIITQGGPLKEVEESAGDYGFQGIIGRAINDAKDPKQAVIDLTNSI